MISKKEIILDYKANISGKRALKIDFLKGISKSNVYISKKTGLIFHKPKISTDKVLKFWSDKIFSNKIDYKNLTYSSENIAMKSRHFYCANFSKKYLIKKNLNYCDFGTGEGNFLKEVLNINKNINIITSLVIPGVKNRYIKYFFCIFKLFFYSIFQKNIIVSFQGNILPILVAKISFSKIILLH